MASVPEIEVEELRELLKAGKAPLIIDVRDKWEHDLCSLPGSRLIPLAELPQRLAELPQGQAIVCHCHHGGRSSRATAYLLGQGFEDVVNLKGGIHAWSVRIDKEVPTY